MKKLLLFVSVLTLGLTSCNKDDDAQSASLEGRWEFSKDGTSINGVEQLQDWDHAAGCTKDNLLFTANTITDRTYFVENGECVEETYSLIYTRSGNTLTITEDGETTALQIVQLDANTLKLKFSEIFDGDSIDYITVFKRI